MRKLFLVVVLLAVSTYAFAGWGFRLSQQVHDPHL
jgi:hypothetical protein